MIVVKAFVGPQSSLNPCLVPWTLTFLHHANFHTALEPAGLAVASVVLGDATVPIEGTGEERLPFHAPPAEKAHALHWVTDLSAGYDQPARSIPPLPPEDTGPIPAPRPLSVTPVPYALP